MTSRRFMPVTLVVLLLAGLGSTFAQANGKIASRVLSETANGGSTEALVVLSQQADLSVAYTLKTKLEKGYFVVNALRTVAGRTQGPILTLLQQRGVPYQSFFIVNMIKVTGDRRLMEELAARADVARIDANPYVRAVTPMQSAVDSFQPAGIEWNVTTGEGAGSLEHGIHRNRPGSSRRGHRGTVGPSRAEEPLSRLGWPAGESRLQLARRRQPAFPDSGRSLMVTALSLSARWWAMTARATRSAWLRERSGLPAAIWMPAARQPPSTYTECFQFLIAPYPVGGGQGDPGKAPDSINNSWGCPPSEGCSYDTLKSIVEAVRAAGIFPAVAAGNSGPNCSSITDPPAIYNAAYTVGATDSNNNIASFSSRGPVKVDGSNRTKPDISAPGQSIRGAVPGNGYQSGWSGTSMATPHIAGGIALLWQANPSLVGNIDQTEANMDHSATHLVDNQAVGNCRGPLVFQDNTFGYGLLNLLKASQQ